MLRNFFTSVALGSLFVGGLAATHLAYAQPGPEGGLRGRGGMMALADANKDGKISKAEMTAAADARFARMDADKDGQLTPKDRDLKRSERLDARFAALDTDRNGQISKAEFAAGHQARADKRAERGGPEGRRWGGRHHRGPGGFGPMAGAGKDGTVTKAQFLAGATERFDRLDANKDGFVTADEMKTARETMRGQWRAREAPQG
jgi:Ca2+-binding EF-hand superfamily protein